MINTVVDLIKNSITGEDFVSTYLQGFLEENHSTIESLRNLENDELLKDKRIKKFLDELEYVMKNFNFFSLPFKEQIKFLDSKKLLFASLSNEDDASESKIKSLEEEIECLESALVPHESISDYIFEDLFERYLFILERIAWENEVSKTKPFDWECSSCFYKQFKEDKRYPDPFENLEGDVCIVCYEKLSLEAEEYMEAFDYACVNGCCACCGCTCND